MVGETTVREMATVLVVDDDPHIRHLLQFNFQAHGYAVIMATEGLEGLKRAQEEHPDAVVLDVMMPRMGGLDVVRALKEDPSTETIPVVVLSAKAQPSDVQQGRAAGADDYVIKPFDLDDLTQRVESLISKER
jgi:DNA-binding response OmpR family regulator